VTLCLPQTPHWLAWNRSWTSEVRGRRPTASAMARPCSQLQMKSVTHSSCKLWRCWQLQNLRLERVLMHFNNKKSTYTRAHACTRTSLKPIFILHIKIISQFLNTTTKGLRMFDGSINIYVDKTFSVYVGDPGKTGTHARTHKRKYPFVIHKTNICN
jgi:hypothetical protein